MKKIFFLLFLFVLPQNVFSQKNKLNNRGEKEGVWEYFYKNSKLKETGVYVNDIKEGMWKGYNDDGTLGFEGTFVSGKKDGKWSIRKRNKV